MTSSSTNAQKTPLARSLERFTTRMAQSILGLTGKSLPCSVTKVVSSGIVEIKFELTNITFTPPKIVVPVFAFEYVRYPIQIGCKGVVIAADAYLGGVSGLGGGTADLTPRPNLSNLSFMPSGNTGWSAAEDPNATILYGPNGVILRDADSTIVFKLQPGMAELTLPAGIPFTINGNVVINGGLGLSGAITAPDGSSTYAGNVATTGNVLAGVGGADQVGLKTHTHTSESPGNQTSAPTGGT